MATAHSAIQGLLVARARACMGVSRYRGHAALSEAPGVVNCFRFTQWLWNSIGVSLPDHQLAWPQALPVSLDCLRPADLVFVPRLNYSLEEDDFGHVGVASGDSTVIHATRWKNGVVEEPLEKFLSRGCLGVRRIRLPESAAP